MHGMNFSRNAGGFSFFSRAAIFLTALLVLCNYYYLYFMDFSQGSTSGAGVFGILRVVAIVLLCSLLFKPVLRRSFRLEELLLLVFFVFGFFVISLKSVIISEGDWMYVNTLICAVPLLFLRLREDRQRFSFFWECCLLIVILQIIGEFFIYFKGMSLWENRAFIGGLGNPSSFGILCNVLVAYVLLLRGKSFFSFLAFSLLCAGIFMTSSMLPTLLLVMVTTIWGVLRSGVKFSLLCIFSIFLLFLFYDQILSEHLRYKLASMVGAVDSGQGGTSASVSIRVQIHKDYLESLVQDFSGFLFYGFSERYYKGVDSQLITYLSSFGLLATGGFWLYSIASFFRALTQRTVFSTFFATSIFIFMVSFLFNRILDYYPMALFFFLLCVSSSCFGVERAQSYIDDEGAARL
ncbi:hypothetical protein L5B88_02980 [Pseudomonas aeruginosa]|nr:hypothetical protein [Pseudomonas aeruginosa]